jgi:hypothetical protein
MNPNAFKSAEQKIASAIANGELSNLPGEGKPLAERNLPQGVTAIEAHITKLLKAQGGGKPKSVEAQARMETARAAATEGMKKEKGGPSTPAAKKAHAAFVEAVKVYNGAVMSDREAFGSAWPLQNAPFPRYREDVAKAHRGEAL